MMHLFRSKSDRNVDLPSPPGYNPGIGGNQIDHARETDSMHLIVKKSWDLALGPLKQVRYFCKC